MELIGFWLVSDKFHSKSQHIYQQVWQGHYNIVNNSGHIRSSFPNSAGLEIIQLAGKSERIDLGKFNEKGNVVFNSYMLQDYEYKTLLLPYSNVDERVDSLSEKNTIDNWSVAKNTYQFKNIRFSSEVTLHKADTYFLLGCDEIFVGEYPIMMNEKCNLLVHIHDDKISILSLNIENVILNIPEGIVHEVPGESGLDTKLLPGKQFEIIIQK